MQISSNWALLLLQYIAILSQSIFYMKNAVPSHQKNPHQNIKIERKNEKGDFELTFLRPKNKALRLLQDFNPTKFFHDFSPNSPVTWRRPVAQWAENEIKRTKFRSLQIWCKKSVITYFVTFDHFFTLIQQNKINKKIIISI